MITPRQIPSGVTLLSRTRAADAESSTLLRSLSGKDGHVSAEVPKGRSINTERVKDLTGGDTLSFRGQHELQPLKFRPTHTLWVYGNDKPEYQTIQRACGIG